MMAEGNRAEGGRVATESVGLHVAAEGVCRGAASHCGPFGGTPEAKAPEVFLLHESKAEALEYLEAKSERQRFWTSSRMTAGETILASGQNDGWGNDSGQRQNDGE